MSLNPLALAWLNKSRARFMALTELARAQPELREQIREELRKFDPPFDARLFEPLGNEYDRARWRAAQRKNPVRFTITESEYYWWIATNTQCLYGGGGGRIRIEMDRRYNHYGYHLWNIVPSCRHHNRQRSNDWSVEEFIDIMKHYPTECLNTDFKPAVRLE
jgi:hypothetical protein